MEGVRYCLTFLAQWQDLDPHCRERTTDLGIKLRKIRLYRQASFAPNAAAHVLDHL